MSTISKISKYFILLYTITGNYAFASNVVPFLSSGISVKKLRGAYREFSYDISKFSSFMRICRGYLKCT